MSRADIVSTGPLPNWFLKKFTAGFSVKIVSDSDPTELLTALDSRVSAIIARGPAPITSEMIARASGLKVIARSGVGYDGVDVKSASQRGIPVVYTPGAMSRAVAEHALALVLTLLKRLFSWQSELQAGDWLARYRELSGDLTGSRFGIIGYGRIGRQLRQLLHPFETEVWVVDPYLKPADFESDQIRFCDLEEVLNRCRIVSLHVPLTVETRGMINRHSLALAGPGLLLINTARGAVVESLDLLLEGLLSRKLGGVGLDVFPKEPPSAEHPLLVHPRAVVTGHVAARSRQSQKQILETLGRELTLILQGKEPNRENLVDPEVLDA